MRDTVLIAGLIVFGFLLNSLMDGIAFSKWRKGSIKGFGNAIVPQVALEIFKAIEKANK